MRMTRVRRGVTLVELTVVLFILGIVAVLAGVGSPIVRRPNPPAWVAQVVEARRLAIDSARPVSTQVSRGDTVYRLTATPDGRVVADTALRVDPLTGAIESHAR